METTIKLIYENECSDLAVYKTPARKVEVTLEATEMDLFVKACGYVPPENCILDYIDNDDFVAHDESKAWPGEKEWQETDRSMMEPSI
jgi:hypothetical protein